MIHLHGLPSSYLKQYNLLILYEREHRISRLNHWCLSLKVDLYVTRHFGSSSVW